MNKKYVSKIKLQDKVLNIKDTEKMFKNEHEEIALAVYHHQDTGLPMLYVTNDGVNFNKVDIDLTSLIAGRDASIVYLNGLFYMGVTWYASDFSYDLVIFTSSDLLNWTRHEINLQFNVKSRTWAPDLFIKNDGTLCMYVSHERVNDDNETMEAWYSECIDIDNLVFTKAVKCTGLHYPNIDAHRFTYKDVDYLLIKTEDTKYIELYRCVSDTGFTPLITGNNSMLPRYTEAPCTLLLGEYLYIYGDRYYDPPVLEYGTQKPICVRTDNLIDYSYVAECNVNSGDYKMSRARHGSLLKLTDETLQIVYNASDNIVINSSTKFEAKELEHLNVENFGTRVGNTVTIDNVVAYPNTVYCVFNNPSGETPTNKVIINNIDNPYKLDDFYLFIECNNNKVIEVPSRDVKLSVTVNEHLNNRMLHFKRGIDGKFALVGEQNACFTANGLTYIQDGTDGLEIVSRFNDGKVTVVYFDADGITYRERATAESEYQTIWTISPR